MSKYQCLDIERYIRICNSVPFFRASIAFGILHSTKFFYRENYGASRGWKSERFYILFLSNFMSNRCSTHLSTGKKFTKKIEFVYQVFESFPLIGDERHLSSDHVLSVPLILELFDNWFLVGGPNYAQNYVVESGYTF